MENLYTVGAEVSLLNDPSKKLLIMKYLSRIYYCIDTNDQDNKLLAYFERELIPITTI